MENDGIRIGTISRADPETGMVSVIYRDRDGEVTDLLPYATFNGEYKPPKPGEKVVVIHSRNRDGMGIVFGTYWNESHAAGYPGEYHKELSEDVSFDCSGGTLAISAKHIRFIAADGNVDVALAGLVEDIRKIKERLGMA